MRWVHGGVDLVLRTNNGRKIIVQCKSHRAPVGPAVARELYGSMVDFDASSAVLVCTGGFTRGVEEFVRGKPITLVSASDLVRLAEQAESQASGWHDLDTPETTTP